MIRLCFVSYELVISLEVKVISYFIIGFLSHVDKEKKLEKSKFFDSSLRAKLSIISSSTQSLVYSIDQKKFFSLSDNLQKLIAKGIVQQPYFDEYDLDDKLSGHREWKKYSEKIVESVIKGKKDRTRSFRI